MLKRQFVFAAALLFGSPFGGAAPLPDNTVSTPVQIAPAPSQAGTRATNDATDTADYSWRKWPSLTDF